MKLIMEPFVSAAGGSKHEQLKLVRPSTGSELVNKLAKHIDIQRSMEDNSDDHCLEGSHE
jgi:hypothetical protein